MQFTLYKPPPTLGKSILPSFLQCSHLQLSLKKKSQSWFFDQDPLKHTNHNHNHNDDNDRTNDDNTNDDNNHNDDDDDDNPTLPSPPPPNLPNSPHPGTCVSRSHFSHLTRPRQYYSYHIVLGHIERLYQPPPMAPPPPPIHNGKTHRREEICSVGLAGTQHDKSLFPLDQLHIPGLPPSQPPQPGEEEGDLMLLQEPSILDPKGLYWKCFIVASLHPWTLALPQLKPLLTHSTPHFPATIHGANLSLQVMRIPKSVWETRGKELGIKGMCVNPRGKEVATLMVHKDMFAGNKMLSKGAQWEE
ncbi:hypothetical protein GG344DRAFT_81390 [Lentinula edodes]|nr:hypothetical protein GG344DRAFT_81390 [Lentinula edodes]